MTTCHLCGALLVTEACQSCGHPRCAECPTVTEIRITIRCATHPDEHAKILRVSPELGRDYAETFAGLLCGTSPMYIHKPGPNSPIGKCATCGGQLTYTIEERGDEPGNE